MVFRRSALLVFTCFAVPLLFAAFTNHAWEDYYITLRSSHNLAAGHGLVFNPGEKVHTFTSPLGVLVPAFCIWITGLDHEQAALWLFRLINAGLLAAAASLAWARFETLKIRLLPRIFFFGVFFLDSKLVDFSTNGMETAILVFFALLLWSELERPDGPRTAVLAVVSGGLMWTRPDAFIFVAALLLPYLVFRKSAIEARRPIPWKTLVTGLVLSGLFYLPWFAWAWWYYGTPVPHTIIAKSQITPPIKLSSLLWIPWMTLRGQSIAMDLFMPAYWFYSAWPSVLAGFAKVLTIPTPFLWLLPKLAPAARRASLALFFGMFYFCAIILFPWYSPPWTAIATLTLTMALDQALGFLPATRFQFGAKLLRIAAALAVVFQVCVLLTVSWEMRVQQKLIEEGVRKKIGLWLKDHSAPKDTVFVECLGYVGYFSQLKIFDYPGLSSPEVVATIRSGKRRFAEVITELRPTWLVLRPPEIADPNKPENAGLRDYEVVHFYNQQPELDKVSFLPGRGWLEHDAQFVLLRRKSPN